MQKTQEVESEKVLGEKERAHLMRLAIKTALDSRQAFELYSYRFIPDQAFVDGLHELCISFIAEVTKIYNGDSSGANEIN